ncbi:GNAT family N-acetyltransferase [Candidatus Enterovibrio escicola]|uniref:GNAT family N-acetyltransferase n=1 Tax=Candidatus Enterovibrio escicola TaxID=1927127 RepID=UPI001CC2F8CB|nr:GNAT family N-acetyltransferase [Candidatus Enterovibrio escacola]
MLTVANVDDAKFILSLRLNKSLNNFVSETSTDLLTQQKWLIDYKKREDLRSEFYFIIKDLNMNPLGTVRIYDFKKNSFCWGSWMVSPNAPRKTAIESALCVYEFTFYTLGFKQSHFNVRNENKKVIKFHERMGAEIVCNDTLNTFFIYKKELYEHTRNKYISFLTL